MEITLDITKRFNSLVNHDYFFDKPPMNPVLILNFSDDISEGYEFELMNFGLNLDKEMDAEFIKSSPYFDDITKCDFKFKRLIITGKAKFRFSGAKGADLQLSSANGEETLYYTWPYKVDKGDYQFLCGGHSAYSAHYLLFYLIADCSAKATITFSSEDYLLIDSYSSELEELASGKQTPFTIKETQKNNSFLERCTGTPGKMIDYAFRKKYFKLFFEEGYNTMVAIDSENDQ